MVGTARAAQNKHFYNAKQSFSLLIHFFKLFNKLLGTVMNIPGPPRKKCYKVFNFGEIIETVRDKGFTVKIFIYYLQTISCKNP